MGERLAKEMHMICLHIESAYRPGIGFADAADFLFDKWSKFTHQNLFPICADTRQSDRPIYR
jgi:hypothetical protein